MNINKFWETKNLIDMNKSEWESLCDKCGKCCVIKLEDYDNKEIHYTNVSCKLLCENTATCSDYQNRKSLVKAAVSGNSKFFLGTDTAPHLLSDKESACGCAGVFNATYCLPILAQLFDNENSLKNLQNFVSQNGAKHYGLEFNKEKILLVKENNNLIFREYLNIEKEKIKIFNPNFSVYWKIKI